MAQPINDGPELIPRNYQDALIRICLKQNSIIFLPTGSGKTFIAICALKELVRNDFEMSYSEGGKITIMIVNTVALVTQHCKNFQLNTPYKVSTYTGDMNVDFWSREQWLQEYNENHVLIMTAQIFKNSLSAAFIDLNKVNVVIFDECHHGVDNHPMREIMIYFNGLTDPPRVIGLTATLLNGNVKPERVTDGVEALEVTFHSKVATVDELVNVAGFSTNPKERIVSFRAHETHPLIARACAKLEDLEKIIRCFREHPTKVSKPNPLRKKYFKKEKPFEKYYKLLMDAQIHIRMLGIAGARIACIVYTIHLHLELSTCSDMKTAHVINSIITQLEEIRKDLEIVYNPMPHHIRTLALSTHKVQKFIELLLAYKKSSQQELCGIIFVERKNTAVILYHLLRELKETYKDLDFIKPDFIVGSNANPLNSTTESLYYAKMNKKIIDKFNSKEVNLLIASNVIEEGVDVPMCSLVIKFDVVKDYRAYIQSKGRARHAESLYYIMVEDNEGGKFQSQYYTFQRIEQNLNKYLIGFNDSRKQPDQSSIEAMYTDSNIYYVDGPGSANITDSSAVQLLMQYCNSAKADAFTVYEPVLYIDEFRSGAGQELKFQVHIEMPIFCAIKTLISGKICDTRRDAKRSAAFVACIQLLEMGELSRDNLQPVQRNLAHRNIDYLFTHWPKISLKGDGVSRNRRPYKKRISKWIATPIQPGQILFLHIINLKPEFSSKGEEAMHKMFTQDLCFGILSANELPKICDFPTFQTLGQITVNFAVNCNKVVLSLLELEDVKSFHHVIFNDVLAIIPPYLMMGDNSTQYAYVVPMNKSKLCIDFPTIRANKEIRDIYTELTTDDKINLVVDKETYFEKIVTPYYRADRKHYVVVEVCEHITALSPFPNDDYDDYASYYCAKYDRLLVSPNLPMLLVRPLSSNLNCLKPRGAEHKRKREESYELLTQHFVPELCVKQDFPAPLWVSATLLPTILHRIEHLLRAEELRSQIVSEAQLGNAQVDNWEPLKVDKRIIKYKIDECIETKQNINESNLTEDGMEEEPQQVIDMGTLLNNNELNKTFNEIMKDTNYPWDAEQEPVDFMRNLDVTQLDIDLFAKFIATDFLHPSNKCSPSASTSGFPQSQRALAINYEPTYVYKPIQLLQIKEADKGPELAAVYEALCTAKAHELVNLERMETLGDSFLKLTASLYIYIKFPEYTEGEATELKGRLISNKNLFYLANVKNLGSLLKMADLNAKDEWLPPGYCAPQQAQTFIESKEMSIESLFNIYLSKEEQISGVLQADTAEMIADERGTVEDEAENSYSSMCHYLGIQMIGDKTIADVVEAVIGVYLDSMGVKGGLRIITWLGILPLESTDVFSVPVQNPIVKENYTPGELGMQLSNFETNAIENIIGYKFRNRAFLLQALTHTSYNANRLTLSYQRLEFIGDAVLDLLITLYIFENNTDLNPGELTDLRSALVNNETFAAYVVKLGLHKYLKHYNIKLTRFIGRFEQYQEQRNHEISSDVLILLNEDHLRMAENVDVPKVLGDLFESIAGAIFLDSDKDLNTVWRVFHKIMHREIDEFSRNIPKNPIRMLYETLAPLKPQFKEPYEVDSNTVMMKLDFYLNGTLTRVHGFGDNKANAKSAAAKIALRLLTVTKK